jgi:methyl-accepting chemotaxis protein
MIERLITRVQSLPQTGLAGIFGLTVGLVFLVATMLAPAPIKFTLAALYLAVGGFGILAERFEPLKSAGKFVNPLLLLVTAFGLLMLTYFSEWWMALTTVAILSTALCTYSAGPNTAFRYSLIPLVAGAAGLLITMSASYSSGWLNTDNLILGLGALIFGQLMAIILCSRSASLQAGHSTSTPDLDLNYMVMQLHVTADGLVRAVDAMNHVGRLQHDGANEQVELIGRTNELLSDFLELSGGIREQARSITQMAQQAADLSQNGQAAIQQAIQGMDEIRAQVSAIAGTILALAQFTQRIDEIITSVSEIATQSNLLALNASIEAARAGTHGRGFAVVADEVRSLSQQSTLAARQVRAILGEIQNAMKETIRATEVGLQGVDSGVNMTQQADAVMVQLAQNVDASHEAVRHIYEVILEQVNGLEEIAISVERIDRITQQNLTSTSTVRTVSQELTRLAADLQTTVGLSERTGLTESVNQDTEGNSEQDTGETQRDPTQDRAPEQTAL